jgi:serine/threonine-protein kinase
MTMVDGSEPQLAACPHCSQQHDEKQLRCPRTDLPLPLEGRLLDEKFRVVGPLGSGGMAAIWLAINEAVDRPVAIKLLRPETARSEELLARFRAEARAAGRIDNEHICEVLDFGSSAIGPYIVMERLQGQDLASLIKAAGHLEPSWAVWIVRQALSGLGAAHAAGIIHRDLKPGNLFLHEPPAAREQRDVIVKVMDFGVSKFLDGRTEAETQSGMLLGTPEYMAPEQLKGAATIDERADIFAMGAILYRALTGKQVFSGPNLAAVLMSMAHDDPTPISELVEGVPRGLSSVVERCLERDPAKRFSSAEELAQALAPYDDRAAFGEARRKVGHASSTPEDHARTVIYDGPPPAPKGRRTLSLMLGAGALLIAVGVFFATTRDDEGAEGLNETGALGDETDAAPVSAREDLPGSDSRAKVPPMPQPTETGLDSGPEPGAGGTGGQDLDWTEGSDQGSDLQLDEGSDEADDAGSDEAGDGGSDEALADGGGNTGAHPRKPPRPPPAGAVRGGAFITPKEGGPAGDQKSAARHCQGLAASHHLGLGRWSLANPSQARAFIGQRELKTARYWTSAIHAGRALVFSLPSGKKHSERLNRRARPLCVVRY